MTLGAGLDAGLLKDRWLRGGGNTTRDTLALPPHIMIPNAARRALANDELWSASPDEASEEVLPAPEPIRPRPGRNPLEMRPLPSAQSHYRRSARSWCWRPYGLERSSTVPA